MQMAPGLPCFLPQYLKLSALQYLSEYQLVVLKKKKKIGEALERAAKHLHCELNMRQNRPYVTSSLSYLKGEEVCLYIITKEILTALSFSTIESEGCVIPCTTYLTPLAHLK